MLEYRSYEESFWKFEEICHQSGLRDYLECLLRVLKTREALEDADCSNPEEIYRTMQKATPDLVRFKGDADLFYQIYDALCNIDSDGIMAFIAAVTESRKEMFVPGALVEKFAEYFSGSTHTVLIAECQQYGNGLLNLIASYPDVEFTLCTRSNAWRDLLHFVYAPFPNAHLISADIYTDGFINSRFDLILAVPVFGMRTPYEGQDFICKDSEMIAVQNLLYHTELEGKLVIVLPAKMTFGSGSVAALRSYIETNYSIKEISALPSGLFSPCTSMKTYLFVFGNGATEEVMIRKYEALKTNKKNAPCVHLLLDAEEMLFPDEFADLNGWNIDMAFGEQDEDMRAYAQSNVRKAQLHDVADVFRGKAVNGSASSGNIGVINISNMTETGIDYQALEMVEEDERKASRYILNEGDVLVTSRGTTIKVAVFEKQTMPCIASANLNVIRPGSRLRGTYLKLFLESPVGIKLLKGLLRGTTVLNINYKDLNDLEIPLLSLEEQDSIIAEYEEGLSLYKQTIAAAEEAWNGVKNKIQTRLF